MESSQPRCCRRGLLVVNCCGMQVEVDRGRVLVEHRRLTETGKRGVDVGHGHVTILAPPSSHHQHIPSFLSSHLILHQYSPRIEKNYGLI